MACGLPCIVTNVGGSPEAVKDQATGLVIPPASAEAAADAVRYLATTLDKRFDMANKARESETGLRPREENGGTRQRHNLLSDFQVKPSVATQRLMDTINPPLISVFMVICNSVEILGFDWQDVDRG
jgi:hypothetical protein